MLKTILKITGTKELSKVEQQEVLGGGNCSSYNGPFCFGPIAGCASCNDYHALPSEYKGCALVHADCEENSPLT